MYLLFAQGFAENQHIKFSSWSISFSTREVCQRAELCRWVYQQQSVSQHAFSRHRFSISFPWLGDLDSSCKGLYEQWQHKGACPGN